MNAKQELQLFQKSTFAIFVLFVFKMHRSQSLRFIRLDI